MKNSYTYLTTEELAGRIKYDSRTIRQCLKYSVLLEGRHYIKPFGRRKILFICEEVEKEMLVGVQAKDKLSIPMASGVTRYG